MGFINWASSLLLSNKKEFTLKEGICFELSVQTYYKKLAINTCINLIANSLVRSSFRTYEKGKEVKRDSYYLFNVQPNLNQNAADFMHELVSKMVYENECLVIMQNKQLFIADGFVREKKVFHENIYRDVVIDDLHMKKVFTESDVFYFKLNNEKVTDLIDGLYSDYGKLIASGMGYYKRNNAMRATIDEDRLRAQTDEEQEAIEDLFNVQFKNFFEAEGGAVLPLQGGLELNEVFNDNNHRAGKDSRDIRALVDDIFDFTSSAFLIPKGLIKGDLAEVEGQTDNFLMFCLAPIAEIIEDETNRKYYTKKEYLERTYLKVDTSMIKYVDIAKLATALDKLLSSGTHSPNENRTLIDKEPIEEDWADKHYITKNYSEAENYLEGGDNE